MIRGSGSKKPNKGSKAKRDRINHLNPRRNKKGGRRRNKKSITIKKRKI